MDILEKLFGSEAKVRIMRLFLFNADSAYSLEEIIERSEVKPKEAKEELATLQKMGLISKKKFTRMVSVVKKSKKKKGKKPEVKTVVQKKKFSGWMLNREFAYLKELQSLLVNTILLRQDEIVKRFSGVGKVKLLVVAGVFIQNTDSRLDILVVGDRIQRGRVASVIRKMEAQIGKELQYAALETQEFKYRLSVYDKLVRDVLDYPHEVLLDRVGVEVR